MPAHFDKTIPRKCGHGTCTRTATGVLYNTRNEEIGPRCTPHGENDAKRMNEEDQI